MSFPKVFISVVFLLICAIVVALFLKKNHATQNQLQEKQVIEITLAMNEQPETLVEEVQVKEIQQPVEEIPVVIEEDETQNVDRIQEFFNKKSPQLPIVQTITYKSKVPWFKEGRTPYIADYASHYKTSRHFIARSLNGNLDYDKQTVSNGDRFNVFREDKDFQFYLLVNLNTCKMRFYYIDNSNGERIPLKTYSVGLGKPDEQSPSHYLTPTGKFTVGDKVAIYKAKSMGNYQGKQVEMIRIFGTRWIPFGELMSDNTILHEGLGIHGLPWIPNDKGELVEDTSGLGKHLSDGCIRLPKKEMEELFSIIITRPTTIEIVNKEF